MLNPEIRDILTRSEPWGWVLEPDAKTIFAKSGFTTPKFAVVTRPDEALDAVRSIGYPVVLKIVSPEVVHKSDVLGVLVGVRDDDTLLTTLERFRTLPGFVGMLIDEMVKGLELIIGAKNDAQFGPMVLVGMGGVGVEIYKDVALRMAPLKSGDPEDMLEQLTAYRLLTGYRGAKPVSLVAIKEALLAFSALVLDMQDLVDSVDLNPVMCNEEACLVVDARIILKPGPDAVI